MHLLASMLKRKYLNYTGFFFSFCCRPHNQFKPLLDFANRMFKRYFVPRREIAVDETLVATKGRTPMLQYIPSKTAKFGVKIWVLAESLTGYIQHMNCYLGKVYQPTPAGTLQGKRLVMNILWDSDLSNKAFIVVHKKHKS